MIFGTMKINNFNLLLAALVCSIASAVSVVSLFSRNLKGGVRVYKPIGEIERLSLPKNVISYEDVRTFEITNLGANDFFRVYINGYHARNNEMQWPWFKNKLFQKEKFEDDYAATRYSHSAGNTTSDHTELLVPGWNQIILEVENGPEGGCGMKISMAINAQTINGFPRILRARGELFYFPEWMEVPFIKWSPPEEKWQRSALCRRQIYQFFLE
jgi:hypothetical protein